MLNHFLCSLIDWVFRRRSVGTSLIKVGVPLYTLVLASLTVGVTIPTKDGPFIFSWDTLGGAAALSWGVFTVATVIVLAGLILITRVALCVSASYDVLDADVRLVEPTAPIVRLDLQDRSTASHWSEQKQQHLAQQFLDTVMSLSRQGVTEIALFLAAPASLSLRLGTVYDKRNLPGVTVNQFEQADPRKFPWAVRMPVAGLSGPQLVQS